MRLWSTDDGWPLGDLATLPDDLLTVHFHPDGSLLVGDLKGKIHQFDVKEKKLARKLDASVLYLRPTVNGFKEINDVGGVRCMASDPAGEWLVAGGTQPATSGFLTGKPTAVCFDFKTGDVKHTWQWEKADPSEGIVMGLAWHPAGFALAATSGQPGKGAVAGWKPREAKEVYLARAFSHSRTLSVHPDGRRVALVQVMLKPGADAGNGRRLTKDGEYLGLISQVKIFDMAAET
jgi:WD40 repeat protein